MADKLDMLKERRARFQEQKQAAKPAHWRLRDARLLRDRKAAQIADKDREIEELGTKLASARADRERLAHEAEAAADKRAQVEREIGTASHPETRDDPLLKSCMEGLRSQISALFATAASRGIAGQRGCHPAGDHWATGGGGESVGAIRGRRRRCQARGARRLAAGGIGNSPRERSGPRDAPRRGRGGRRSRSRSWPAGGAPPCETGPREQDSLCC